MAPGEVGGAAIVTRMSLSKSFPRVFVSADWSKDSNKRSVHVADLEQRRIWREERSHWDLQTVLLRRFGSALQVGAPQNNETRSFGIESEVYRACQCCFSLSGGNGHPIITP